MNDKYSDREIQKRMDDAVKRALSTPPKPNSEFVGKGKRGRRLVKESSPKNPKG